MTFWGFVILYVRWLVAVKALVDLFRYYVRKHPPDFVKERLTKLKTTILISFDILIRVVKPGEPGLENIC
jgi:hypothetical protein